MKIYLVKTKNTVSYDEYDAIVVCAKSRKRAISVAADSCDNFVKDVLKDLITECLGTANKKQVEGEVLASFNAA